MSFGGDSTRRDALARNLCARICDDRRSVSELRRFDSMLGATIRERERDPLRVYIAASSAELVRVHASVAALRKHEVDVVSTWPDIVAATQGGANPADANKVERLSWSSQDLFEVTTADVLLFLVPRSGTTRGAWFEAGAAWSHGLHLIFAGSTKQSVFCATGEEFDHDTEALARVIEMARRRT